MIQSTRQKLQQYRIKQKFFLLYVTLTLFTAIEDDSRQFILILAVADIKYNFPNTPFFEEYIHNFNIQDFTLQFKHHSKVHSNHTKYLSVLSEDYPYFSYIDWTNSRTETLLKPISFKIAHLPITPKCFSPKIRTIFNFIEVLTHGTCATIIQNCTDHIATLPTGHIGFIEVPITNKNPKYYHVNVINTSVHTVAHTYHPDITEPTPQTLMIHLL